MNKFGRFLKFKLKYSFSIENIKKTLGGSTSKGKFIAVAIILGNCALLIYGLFLLAAYIGLDIAAALGTADIVLRYVLSLGQLVILFFSLFSVFGLMYGGKDSELILTLPLKSSHVFMANLTSSYVSEFALTAAVLLPVLIFYSLRADTSVLYWVFGIIGLFFYPVIPIVVAAVLVMIFNSFMSKFKHKDLLGTILGFAFIIAVVVFQMTINTRTQNTTGAELENIIKSLGDSVDLMTAILPGGGLLGLALTSSAGMGAVYLAAIIAIAVLLILLCGFLGGKLYYRLLQRLKSASGDSKKVLEDKKLKSSSVTKAFFMKEWKIALRTPAYMLNGLANIIIGPVVFWFFSNNSNLYGVPEEVMNGLNKIMILISLGIILLVAMMNYMWGTTFSREGKAFWILKTSPADVKAQIKGRFLAGYTMHLAYCVPMLTIVFIMMKFELPVSVLVSLITIVAGLYMAAVGMMLDVRAPKLEWKSETEAIKSNVNGIFEMLISLVISLVVVIPSVVCILFGVNIKLALCCSLAAAVIFAVIFIAIMIKYCSKRFKMIKM